MSSQDWINVSHDARGVACVTIVNATKLNTLNRALMEALITAIEALMDVPNLRAVVLRGAGTRAFIGGADITEMAALNAGSARDFITLVHRSCDVFRRLPVPVIARIQGYVLGAGLEVAAACDMRVAATDAVFGMPEVRIGIPSVVEAALLPQLIGWGRTRTLLLTGDTIDAATAERWGLVEQWWRRGTGRIGGAADCFDPGLRTAGRRRAKGADPGLGRSSNARGDPTRHR